MFSRPQALPTLVEIQDEIFVQWGVSLVKPCFIASNIPVLFASVVCMVQYADQHCARSQTCALLVYLLSSSLQDLPRPITISTGQAITLAQGRDIQDDYCA